MTTDTFSMSPAPTRCNPADCSTELPTGYTVESWPWGGWMTWKDCGTELEAMERGATRDEAVQNLNARLTDLKNGWSRRWGKHGSIVWRPPKNRK